MDKDIIIALIAACIPAAVSVVTILVSNSKASVKTEMQIKTLSEDVKKLEAKVAEHNNFGLKIVELQTKVKILEQLHNVK